MKIRFIINPIAGTGKQKGIEDYISENFKNADIKYTQKSEDATTLSKEAVNNNFDAVIAIGGDGTINECLKGLVNSNTALGVIPCGSGNGFAYHLGMSSSIKEAISQLKDITIQTIDTCTTNNMPFMNVSGIGFDAHIANLFSNIKTRGFMSYIKLVINELNYQPQEYSITYNNNTRNVSAYMISFANASQYGNNAKISPKSDIKDGLIDFVIVKVFPKWKIPLFLLKLMNGKLHHSNYVEIIKSNYMQIHTNSNLIHLDGEPKEINTPIEIKLLPSSLKILKPNEKR